MADGVEEKTYSAKQVATRIGTDAKQLRKFFRDPQSGYKPVGQGGRYDFPESEILKIKTAFDAWNSTKVRRNRQPSAEKKLATAAGLIPGQRTKSPGTDTPPRPRRRAPESLLKDGLHGNALDNDNFSERTAGIGARVKRHGLVPNQQGRLVEEPEHLRKAREIKPIEYPDLSTIPGLSGPEPQWIDNRPQEEIDEELKQQALAEFFEPRVDPDDPDFELELEEDCDIEGT
jgi:hypothetical protein